MHLRCDGIFSGVFIANLMVNLSVKDCENWLAFGKVSVLFF